MTWMTTFQEIQHFTTVDTYETTVLYCRQLDLLQFVADVSPLIQEEWERELQAFKLCVGVSLQSC